MFHACLALVLYSKIINSECEGDATGFALAVATGMSFAAAMLAQELMQAAAGGSAGFLELAPCLPYSW